MIFSENRLPSPIEPGTGFSGSCVATTPRRLGLEGQYKGHQTGSGHRCRCPDAEPRWVNTLPPAIFAHFMVSGGLTGFLLSSPPTGPREARPDDRLRRGPMRRSPISASLDEAGIGRGYGYQPPPIKSGTSFSGSCAIRASRLRCRFGGRRHRSIRRTSCRHPRHKAPGRYRCRICRTPR